MNIDQAITGVEELKQALAPLPSTAIPADRASALVRSPFVEVALGALHTASANLGWHKQWLAGLAAAAASPPPAPHAPAKP